MVYLTSKKRRKEKQPNNEFCLSLLLKKSAELLLNMYNN